MQRPLKSILHLSHVNLLYFDTTISIWTFFLKYVICATASDSSGCFPFAHYTNFSKIFFLERLRRGKIQMSLYVRLPITTIQLSVVLQSNWHYYNFLFYIEIRWRLWSPQLIYNIHEYEYRKYFFFGAPDNVIISKNRDMSPTLSVCSPKSSLLLETMGSE